MVKVVNADPVPDGYEITKQIKTGDNMSDEIEAKKELLNRQIDALMEELEEKQVELNNVVFDIDQDYGTWNKQANEIKKLVAESRNAWEILMYLASLLDNLEQSNLDEFEEEEEEE